MLAFTFYYHLFHSYGKNELYLDSQTSFMNALYLAQLKQSLFIMDLRLEEIKEHVDAMERKLKNLRNNVLKVAEDIGGLLESLFDEPII